MKLLSAITILTPIMSAAACARQDIPHQPHTAAAVLAVDRAWTDAEIRGDAAFVDALLLPEYRSISSSGGITPKSAILAGTRGRGPHSDFGKRVDAYRSTHPTRGEVIIEGDTAILAWISLVPGKGEPIASCDIFVYRDGRWRALYSQHSTAEM